MRDSLRRRTAGAMALVLLACSLPLRAQLVHPSAIPIELAAPIAPRPVHAEGKQHLLYELHITNFGRTELTLERIEVLSADDNAVRATYAGETLEGVLLRPGVPVGGQKRLLGPGLRAVASIDVIAPASTAPPARLRHRLVFSPVTPPNAARQSVVEGAAVEVAGAIVPFGPPLAGAGWLALHGLSNESTHRRTLLAIDGQARIAQRFAVDWSRIAPDGQVFKGDPSRNANWAPYEAAVLAMADGRVVDVQDGIPENDPTSRTRAVAITLATAGGNFVILDLGRGLHAFYAHLQPGSFCVRPGDQVRRGDMLARLGNSGQSDAPHLHLHIVDGPSPLAAEGLPMVFERFQLLGHVPSLKVLTDGTGWKPTGDAHDAVDEMPVENAVVAFPASPGSARCAAR